MKRLEALEGLRGYAAFLVFLTHAFGFLAAKLYGVDPDSFELYRGMPAGLAAAMLAFRSHYGVDLFFVLSGVLMADVAARRWPGSGPFLARRLLRIYPAYLATFMVALVASAVLWDRTTTWGELAGNGAFLQGFNIEGIAPVNPVTWSLSFEAAFYLAVPLLALAVSGRAVSLRGAAPVLFAAFIAIVAGAALIPGGKAIFLAYFALFVPGIYLGLMAPEARAALARRVPAALAVGGWIAFEIAVKIGALPRYDAWYYVASGVAGGLLVLKACDGGGMLARLLTLRPVLWLGRYSYSFFLVHYVVLHVMGLSLDVAIGTQDRAMYSIAVVAGGFVVSAITARLLYEVAERFYFERR